MAELNARELAIKEAVEVAEDTRRAAFDSTEQRYWGFITLISQNKRVGGPKNDPWYAPIKVPYIRVDGRIKMAEDEHKADGGRLNFSQPDFIKIMTTPEYWLCRVTVDSSIRGSRTAHAKVTLQGGVGAEATNPFETAETSAIGRALGFMGYGLLGSGVASAEEVLGAMSEREATGGSRKVAEVTDESFMSKQPVQPVQDMQDGDWNAPGNFADQAKERSERAVRQMSDRQANYLFSLLQNLGVEAGDVKGLADSIFPDGLTSGMASSEINELKEAKALPRHWVNGYVKMLLGRPGQGSTMDDVTEYTKERYGETLPSSLGGEEQKELFAWLTEADIAF